MKARAWTRAHCRAACAQGWCVFNGHEIQRDDQADVFSSDRAAVAYVKRQARRGRPEAIRALELHNLLTFSSR